MATTVDLIAAWAPILLEPGDALSLPVTIPAGYDTGTWTAAVYADRRQTTALATFTVAGPTSLVVTLSLTSVQTAALCPTGTSRFTGYWELVRTVAGSPRTWIKGDFIVDAGRQSASNGTQAVTVSINAGAITVTASAANAFQPLDADLSTIAGLSPGASDFLQFVSGNWVNRTPTQARTALAATTKYAALIGDGASTTLTVTHSLGTVDVEIQLRDASTGVRVDQTVTVLDANTVTVGPFLTAPTTNSLKVVVVG
jgi:hypothetical protein